MRGRGGLLWLPLEAQLPIWNVRPPVRTGWGEGVGRSNIYLLKTEIKNMYVWTPLSLTTITAKIWKLRVSLYIKRCLPPPQMIKMQIWMFQKIVRFFNFWDPHNEENMQIFVHLSFQKIYVGHPHLLYINLSDNDLGPFLGKRFEVLTSPLGNTELDTL